ncbi:hypothetical protein [Natronobacterium gregoryi]|uniref:Uncharacterized protein n=2 Tax=Natronobacterium gregoryi TaxID=44930 RepID=L0ALU6_NATGS|nr:hypothetical protein [Natronobacterium gregoryi]AFZ74434.1 hypothetical protein Natgr_3309 [Natronobacterium gregoryi SP2]ELY72106.1 hypothetical protein C490_04102 [Natronobacterium gregoryi SP2]PLK19763.1 hypothetical protein CYV19_13230 [Natronobacterium gregoryi SP2]SFJ40910.1 hypothetical protein SAMN05443661_12735 [Natronobacterium gregoryi]
MTEDSSRHSSLESTLEAARLVYGVALVDDQPTFLECIDADAFDDGHETALYTAFNSVGATLVPFVHETEAEVSEERVSTVVRALEEEPPRVTSFDRAATTVDTAVSYYILVDVDGDWKRLRNVASDQLPNSPVSSDPQLTKYAVAVTLVEETSERFAEFPPTVDAEDVELIDWSG